MAVIPDLTVIFIFIQIFFAYVTEFLFLSWFWSLFFRDSISFFSQLIISVACSFRFAQNFFIEFLLPLKSSLFLLLSKEQCVNNEYPHALCFFLFFKLTILLNRYLTVIFRTKIPCLHR